MQYRVAKMQYLIFTLLSSFIVVDKERIGRGIVRSNLRRLRAFKRLLCYLENFRLKFTCKKRIGCINKINIILFGSLG
jgi:hypothetical protein